MKGQSYDIICHTTKAESKPFSLKEPLPGTRVGYDIVNNLDFNKKRRAKADAYVLSWVLIFFDSIVP
jgi:hypothetical protein